MWITLFLSIPGDVLRDRITLFFDALSLVRLDSAVLSKEHRPQLLNNILHNAILNCEVWYNLDFIMWLSKRCVHVTSLCFPPNAEPADVELATSILSRAQFVLMRNCDDLTNESVQHMLRNCGSESLKGLDCKGCEWLNDETLKVLADNHSKSLTEFPLGGSPSVTDTGAAYLLSRCQCVAKVQWENCEQVGARAMAALGNHSIDTFLTVNCPAIPESSVVSFLQTNNDCLRNVAFVGNHEITDRTLLAIARHCPSLVSLVITNTEGADASLCAVIKSCQRLNELSTRNCNVTSTVLDYMGAHLSPTLTELGILGCADFTTEQIIGIACRAPLLRVLNIGCNGGLDNSTLKAIGAHCVHLETLNVDMCAAISLVGIRELVKNCPQLAELTFTSCPNVNDKCLAEIARSCPNLRQLHVRDSSCITNRGIAAFTSFNAKLETVGLGYTNINQHGVMRLMEACPALCTVEMQGQEDAVSQALLDAAEQFGVTLVFEEEDEQSDDSENMQEAYGSDDGEGTEFSEDDGDSEEDDQE